eukprot:s873_g22.t1
MVGDNVVSLRQVPTLVNFSDIGTQSLGKQRLLFLMHESGLVYVATFEDVGVAETQRQHEKSGSSQQIKKISKIIFRMSFAKGLEPIGAMARKCIADADVSSQDSYGSWAFMLVILLTVVLALAFRFAWKKLKTLQREVVAYEDDFNRVLSSLEDAVNCIRYGLMQFGGFVRNQALSAAQMAHMFTQECANFVLWNVQRKRAEHTDHMQSGLFNEEGEEALTEDEEEAGPAAGMTNLMDAMRAEQNTTLANEMWLDAAEIRES